MAKKRNSNLHVKWEEHPIEVRNAWRIIVYVADMFDSQLEGSIDHLPIRIGYPEKILVKGEVRYIDDVRETVFRTHDELVAYGFELLMMAGIQETTVDLVLSDTKRTKLAIQLLFRGKGRLAVAEILKRS